MPDVQGRITIKDLARSLGLSAATVSLALNDGPGVNQETRQRVKTYALRVRYRPNASARAISTGRTQLVAVVLDRLTVSFFEEIVQGIENVAVRRNYDVLVNTVGDEGPSEADLIERLIGRHIDGLIAATLRLSPSALQQLEEVGIPVLRLLPELEGDQPAVTVDNRAGGRLAARHLLNLGHRRVLFVGNHLNIYCRLRAEGANEVFAPEGAQMEVCPVDDPLDMGDAYESFLACLRHSLDFTAVFCADDIIAIGVCKALQES